MPNRNIHTSGRVRAVAASALALALVVAAAPLSASAAASTTIDFTASGYSVGALKPAGQNGWWQGKVADFSLVDNSSFPASGLPSGGRSLQFSNATIPSGGAHLISPPIDPAGEPSTNAGSTNTFEAQFTVASATGAIQTGLDVDVALDGASRFGGVINMRHTAAGLEIGSYWVPKDATNVDNASWRSVVFTTVSATVPHTVRAVATFLEGQPDAFQVFVDGTLVSEGSGATTWEYYSTLASPGAGDRSVDSLSFKSSASAPTPTGIGYTAGLPTLPSAAGQGFLFTGISYASSTAAPPLPTTPPTLPTAPDASPDASLVLSDDTVTGGSIDFSASGYLPYENVYATIFPTPTFGGWFQADASGDLDGTLALPSDLAYGAHDLQTTGSVTGWVAGATFTKVPVPLPTEPPVLPTTPDPAPDVTLTLEDNSVTGGDLTFSADGFLPYENVYATIFSTPTFGGWFQADVAGDLEGNVTLPTDLTYGAHTLQLTGSVSGWVASDGFTKVPAPLPTEPPVLPTAPDPTPDAAADLGDDTPTGTTVTFTAAGFDPYENAFVTIFSTPVFGGWFQADASGVVSGTVTLPAGLAAGTHTLQVTGETSGWTAAVEFTLAAATPAPSALPLTGLEPIGGLIGAGLLLAGGAAFLVVRRRFTRAA